MKYFPLRWDMVGLSSEGAKASLRLRKQRRGPRSSGAAAARDLRLPVKCPGREQLHGLLCRRVHTLGYTHRFLRPTGTPDLAQDLRNAARRI